MKSWLLGIVVVLGVVTGASAQNGPAAAPETAAAPAPGGRKAACQATAQSLKGQEKRDQIQLCLAQAHLDCVKQAIDQKTVGPQRRDFIKTCIGG
jgi:hypothetical protein